MTVSPAGPYHYGDTVTLTATADIGWTFAGFSGDTATNSITIDGNKTVTAAFTQNEYTLTINKIGSGTVTADPAKTTYHYDDVVTLTAIADTGWTFGGFSGDTATNSITIDGNKTVTAAFTQNEYSLSINTIGSGTVTVLPSGSLSLRRYSYSYGSTRYGLDVWRFQR